MFIYLNRVEQDRGVWGDLFTRKTHTRKPSSTHYENSTQLALHFRCCTVFENINHRIAALFFVLWHEEEEGDVC